MSMQEDLLELARIKAQSEALAVQKAEVEARLAQDLRSKGQKTLTATVAGAEVKGTLVAPQRVTIDEQKIHDALDAKTWKKVTKQVLDTDKLEAAVALGDVDANVVAAASDIKDTKPYVKVTGDIKAVAAAGYPVPAKVTRQVKPPKKR